MWNVIWFTCLIGSLVRKVWNTGEKEVIYIFKQYIRNVAKLQIYNFLFYLPLLLISYWVSNEKKLSFFIFSETKINKYVLYTFHMIMAECGKIIFFKSSSSVVNSPLNAQISIRNSYERGFIRRKCVLSS